MIQTWKLGKTADGRDLEALVFAPRSALLTAPPVQTEPTGLGWPTVLFLGGVHGDEIEGVWLLDELVSRWRQAYPSDSVGAIVLGQANPDGIAAGRRWNARDIDLNRNLPSQDWTPEIKNPRYPPGPSPASEPETQALVRLITTASPAAILSAHSFSQYQVNINGPARAWGESLASRCHYPVTEDIGYPTPGCLGTYAGRELGIPTITLEIERGLSREAVIALHLPVMEEALRFWEKGN